MASEPLPEAARENIQTIRALEAETDRRRTRADRVSDAVSRFAGSFYFLFVQAFVILVWVSVNLALDRSDRALDPFPFDFLTLMLDIEVIFLSTFVLMSQDRQSRDAEQRGHINLQVALLAEQETTKMLQMLRAISERLGLHEVSNDPELAKMLSTTHIGELARELEKTRDDGTTGEQPETAPPQ